MPRKTQAKKTKKSQEKPGGNTKTPGSNIQYYRWFFTIPYEECTASQLSQNLLSFCKKFSFQGEIGESGYKHWQGQISLITKEYMSTVKNHFTSTTHLEPTKNVFAAENYTTKIETRFDGPYNEKSVFLDTISESDLFEWQKEIETIHNSKPDKRIVYWYWSNDGCKGKTQFIKYMYKKYDKDINIVGSGKSSDMAHIISKNKNAKTVMIFVPRKSKERFNYGMLEEIKDGLIMSGKYDSETIIFNNPHVFVFTNFKPDTKALSEDRWVIRNVD